MPEVATDLAGTRVRERARTSVPGGPAQAPARSSSGSSTTERIRSHLSMVEAVLARQLDDVEAMWADNTVGTCDQFGSDLPRRLRELIEHGGKRTRPLMVFLGWLAAGGSDKHPGLEHMRQAAAAVEMLHCFALVHDDLMDESPTRRGHATVHERAAQLHRHGRGIGDSARFGDSIAVLVGDLAHSEADRLAGSLPSAMRRVWQQMVVELLAGQAADVVGSAAADRRVDAARFVARQKTGYYTVARPLQLGAVAAGAGPRTLDTLADFGRHAGEAFALRDDILGVFGDPRTTGKPAGDDIRSGKPTVLLALSAQALTGDAAAALRLAGTPAMTDEDVRTVQHAMVHTGVLGGVEAMIEDRVCDAVAALDLSALNAAGVSELTRVVDELARRGR